MLTILPAAGIGKRMLLPSNYIGAAVEVDDASNIMKLRSITKHVLCINQGMHRISFYVQGHTNNSVTVPLWLIFYGLKISRPIIYMYI